MEGILITSFELLAAFSGFYHLSKKNESRLRPLVYFLVITVFVEAVGSYRNFYGKLDFVDALIGTKFENNLWLYNGYVIVSLFFFLSFYRSILSNLKNKKILKILLLTSILVTGLDLYYSGSKYFETNLGYSFICNRWCSCKFV